MKVRKCRARIRFGDDQGDNDCTFRCDREKGHGGPHMESGKIGRSPYAVSWGKRGVPAILTLGTSSKAVAMVTNVDVPSFAGL